MKTFHADNEIKEKYLNRVRDHRARGQIVQGLHWEGGRGGAVGCTIHSPDIEKTEEIGIPSWLGHLEERIFEGLSRDSAIMWPETFLESIPVGLDVDEVVLWNKFSILILEFVVPFISDDKKGVIATTQDLHNRVIAGDSPADNEWYAARAEASAFRDADRAAASAAIDLAWAAVEDVACPVAGDAARAATWAAVSAASAATSKGVGTASWNAAMEAAWRDISNKLIELMQRYLD